MKYRSEGDLGAQEDPAVKKRKKEAAIAAAASAAASKKAAAAARSRENTPRKEQLSGLESGDDLSNAADQSIDDGDNDDPEEEEIEAKAATAAVVATKTTVQDLTTIGVGTFSIDKESVRGMQKNN